MKENHLRLLRILIDQTKWCTASALASSLKVSVRTIKNYVVDINQMSPNTITSSKDGYIINFEAAKHILDDNQNQLPQSSQDRVVFIIHQLVKTAKSIDSYALCDELYISMSTLKNELKKVKRKISKFDLQLLNHNEYLSLKGIEKNKRKLLSSILYDESSVNFVNLKTVQKAFTDINIALIKNIVVDTFEAHHYFVNDYALINLVLHITIAIDRIKHHDTSFIEHEHKPIIKLHEYALAQSVVDKLEEQFNIQYTEGELYELALLLISHVNTQADSILEASSLEQLVGYECIALVKELVNDVNAYYYINLSESEFLTRFTLHIRNLLVRAKNNYASKNPLSEGIQLACPLIYDAALNLASTIEKCTGLTINGDEIAYIAFHIGSALETQKALSSKVNVVIYCPNYYDMNKKISNAVNTYFSSSIIIKNVLTNETEFENIFNADLIITTIPIRSILSIPTSLVSFLFNEKDQYLIREKIDEIRITKKRSMLKAHLKRLIFPALFEKNETLSNASKTITHMCSTLVNLNYVSTDFEKEILEREKIATTAFHAFAVPHTLKMNANKTSMSILISEKGIDWYGEMVHLVLMLSFNKHERYIFNEIFDVLTMILTYNENIRKIIKCKDYQTFIEILISFVVEP